MGSRVGPHPAGEAHPTASPDQAYRSAHRSRNGTAAATFLSRATVRPARDTLVMRSRHPVTQSVAPNAAHAVNPSAVVP